jgi:hypothetical protein
MLKDKRLKNLRKQLKRAKFGGGGTLALGLINLLDSYTPFPIPLTGSAAWISSIILIAVGGIWFYQYFRPRVDDIVHLGAKHTNGYLTVVIVHELLGIPVKTAANTLLEMYREGIIKKISSQDKRNIYECVFLLPNVEKQVTGGALPGGFDADDEPVTTDEVHAEILDAIIIDE